MPAICEKPCYHAICVGVAHHPSLRPLPFADADAARVHRHLVARRIHSTLLTGVRASKARFLETLHAIGRGAHDGDHVLIYFSGHGGSDAHAAPEAHQDRPEFLQFGVGRVFDHELAAALTAMEHVNVLAWLDACQAGGMAGTATAGVLGRTENAARWAQLIASSEEAGFATGQIGVGSHLTNAILAALGEEALPKTYEALVQDVGDRLEGAGKKRPTFIASSKHAARNAFALGLELPVLDGDNLQAHTLLGFPRFHHQALLFFHAENSAQLRERLRSLDIVPTSARQLLSDSDGLEWGTSISFTFEGLAALGAPRLRDLSEYSRRLAPQANSPQPDAPGYYQPADPNASMGAFERGMDGRSRIPLRDPWTGLGATSRWVVGDRYKAREHGLLIIGATSPSALSQRVDQLRASAQGLVFNEQIGYRHKENLEHFGFRDGVSRPGIAGRLRQSASPHAGIIPANATQVYAPEQLFLMPPGGPSANGTSLPSWAEFGSFLAYRRLNQDVHQFRAAIRAIAVALNVTQEQAAALLIGRTRGGVSLADHAGKLDNELLRERDDLDSFDYSAGVCPAFAHARKANPRTSDRPEAPLFRRGMLFGDYLENPDSHQDDESERGLHFLSYQASIEAQFETVMRWIHDGDVPHNAAGVDALLGRRAPVGFPQQREFSVGDVPISISEFVHATGGSYLFAPSLSGFRTLLAGT